MGVRACYGAVVRCCSPLLLSIGLACAACGDGAASNPDGGGGALVNAAGDAEVPLEHGLRGDYFARYRDLVLEQVEPNIDHVWADQAPAPEVPADFFSARWTGFLDVPAAGDYTFWVSTDDGMRVWVDDQLVIDAWSWQRPTRYEGAITLSAGRVAFRVDYMERDLTAEARVGWRADGLDEAVIPTEALWAAPQSPGLPAPQSPYLNPVIAHDCPDPGVLADRDADGAYVFYALCTGGRFPLRTSRDLVFWDDTGSSVLPAGKPPWAANGNRNWAPEIHRVGNRYVVYYTTVNGANVLSIGAAWATTPEGPYTDIGGPLVEDPQGVIDAHFTRDTDGLPYLVYKIDGNATGKPTPIYIRELAAGGLSFAAGSQATEILRNDASTWEGGVVEAPWIIHHGGYYYLFYSGNVYDYRYRTGVARATSITGPYTKHGAPILGNNSRWVGPGHGSVLDVDGQTVFVYHAWPALGNGTNDTSVGREVLVDRVDWQNDWPVIGDGTPGTAPSPPIVPAPVP